MTTTLMPGMLHPTKNDLDENIRVDMVRLNNETLATGIHLALQAKQAHWNVKGPSFLQLHELFDQIHTEAQGWIDNLAERAVQLGGIAEGTLETTRSRSLLPEHSLATVQGRDHLEAVSVSLSTFGKQVRGAIRKAEESGDSNSADLFTEVSRGVDKMLWFVEAHLQDGRSAPTI
jgi:starvation-inducible DNA-binding protein